MPTFGPWWTATPRSAIARSPRHSSIAPIEGWSSTTIADGVERGRALRGCIVMGRDDASTWPRRWKRWPPRDPVAVIGYCFGGGDAWMAAHSVPHHGGGRLLRRRRGRVHRSRPDRADDADPAARMTLPVPVTDAESVPARYPEVAVDVYDGAGHGVQLRRPGVTSPRGGRAGPRSDARLLAEHGVSGR